MRAHQFAVAVGVRCSNEERRVSRRAHVRVAAAVMTALLAFASGVVYLGGYQGAFADTDTVTLTSQRAGLVMDRDAKVKFLGVPIGTVSQIDYDGPRRS